MHNDLLFKIVSYFVSFSSLCVDRSWVCGDFIFEIEDCLGGISGNVLSIREAVKYCTYISVGGVLAWLGMLQL
jgi:hypothetical protein